MSRTAIVERSGRSMVSNSVKLGIRVKLSFSEGEPLSGNVFYVSDYVGEPDGVILAVAVCVDRILQVQANGVVFDKSRNELLGELEQADIVSD
jgi:hypothetical protein